MSDQKQKEEQIEKMIANIIGDSLERVAEIRIRAEYEFQEAKKKIVKEEKQRIDTEYQRKTNQVKIEKRIAQSNLINQSRLKLLQAKFRFVQQILAEAHFHLSMIFKNEQKYKKILELLITQGLLKMMEPQVILQCRKCDLKLVKEVIPDAIKEFTKRTDQICKVVILESKFLPPPPQKGSKKPSCSGGVVLNTANGRITCTNTLDYRLMLAYDGLLPKIRSILFKDEILDQQNKKKIKIKKESSTEED
ncbi:atpase h -transporting v1 subunit e1a-related [Anaeramoeba flamelloides]|uniref:Atpase h -transporting v1 subunit e1a-related n=1 Tax=Anaeramoeba flamelloides TaxID=1746091 RepID=A0AAV7Z6L3_9EUKA|nr:atpase h -transporting v1 subunit e1a-related [Anaeramoeba flamelloides]